jgi:hypothetical protein
MGFLIRTAERRQVSKTLDSKGLTSSRGDKTTIELFIAGIRGWEAGLRQTLGEHNSLSH